MECRSVIHGDDGGDHLELTATMTPMPPNALVDVVEGLGFSDPRNSGGGREGDRHGEHPTGRSFDPVNRQCPCALVHVLVKTPVISRPTVNEQNFCSLSLPRRLTFGPKTWGFLDERPEFSNVARAETANFC